MTFLRRIIATDQEHRRMSADSIEKRRVAARRRAEWKRQQLRLADEQVGWFDRYVVGKTAADVLKTLKRGLPLTEEQYDSLEPELQATWRKALRARVRDTEERREIAEQMSWAQKYLFNLTPADLQRNRRRLAAEKRREEMAEWDATHEREISDATRERAASVPWWRYSDTVDADIRREAVREARRSRRRERKEWGDEW